MVELRTRALDAFAEILSTDHAKCLETVVFNFVLERAKTLLIKPAWTEPGFETLYAQTVRGLLPYVKSWTERIHEDPLTASRTLVHASAKELDPDRWIDLESLHREGFETCRRCGGKNTTYHQVQMRSSDEPMTVFVRCLDCGKRWKM